MAQRFAVKTGNWSDTTMWDSGALPVSGDVIYPNGFTVTIDQDINVASLNNNIPPVSIPNIATPAMTSNTQPSGTVISSNNSGTAYNAFNQDNVGTVYWASGVNNTGWIGYTFSTGKVIKRYIIKQYSVSGNFQPKTWTFEGSNDGFATAGVPLDIVASYTTIANYTSVLLANTTSYTSYRLNVTATNTLNANVIISELEMTESTTASPVYGATTGGSFTVPASLSGTRNIVQSGAGIVSNNVLTSGIVQTNHITGNTVNFNVQSGGYIINPTWVYGNTNNVKAVAINGNGTVNFNGNIWGHTGIIYNDTLGASIYINANATVTINGNVYAPAGNALSESYTILSAVTTSASATLNINGDIIGSGTIIRSFAIFLNSVLTLNITGNLTSNKGYCLQSSYNNIINIIGNATLTDSISANAIYMLGLSPLITMNGSITNKGNSITIFAAKLRFASTSTPYWIFQTNGASDMTLSYGTPVTGAYPTEADVRFGTTYAASPTRTGTLRVPLPQYVSQGVLTDNTVGTAYINATDVWNVLSSSITTAGSIGERLKVASTVETTGDQLAAYIV